MTFARQFYRIVSTAEKNSKTDVFAEKKATIAAFLASYLTL